VESFCGSGHIQDSYIHFRTKTIELRTYPYVCFAYKGAGLYGQAYAHVDYYDVNSKKYEGAYFNILDDGEELESSEEAEWQYNCWNILDRFDELYPEKRNPAKQLNMWRFDIPYGWSERTRSWIDELRFAKEPIHISREPGLPSPDFILNKARVKNISSTSETDYRINLLQYSCPTERFPLFGIESEVPGNNCTLIDINSSDPAMINQYLSNVTSQNATFHCDDWPAG
jgi:hypothetical protein